MDASPPDWLEDTLREIGSYQINQKEQIDVNETDEKGRIDLVTDIDRQSEEQLVARIREEHPEDGILTEEELSRSGRSDREWIIDPLDGTTNYVHHHPFYGISVALQDDNMLEKAVTFFPEFEDLYYAENGSGAYKNGRRIHVSQNSNPIQSFLATGFADLRNESEQNRHNLDAFRDIIRKVQGIRRGGSAVHDLCLTAEGVFDGFWEFNLKPWDVAAGGLLVREAGGTVTDMSGSDGWMHDENIVATNQVFHETLLEWLEPYRPNS